MSIEQLTKCFTYDRTTFCFDDDDDDDDDADDGDDNDCPLIMRPKNSMHNMLVAQGRRDIQISKYNKSITNFRKKKRKKP